MYIFGNTTKSDVFPKNQLLKVKCECGYMLKTNCVIKGVGSRGDRRAQLSLEKQDYAKKLLSYYLVTEREGERERDT